MNSTLQTISAAIAGCVIGASITTEGVTVNNASGLTRVLIGTDDGGSGFMVILNNEGEELFAVREDQVEPAPRRTPDATSKLPTRPVQLISFETLEPDEELAERVKSLSESLAQLEAQLDSTEYRNRAKRRSEIRRKKEEYRKLASELEDELQIIHCWDGSHPVTLVTTLDLSRRLHRIPAFGFLTFKGRRTGIDDGHETYEVVRIVGSTRPDGFADYSPPSE